jgi:hypothetical protein
MLDIHSCLRIRLFASIHSCFHRHSSAPGAHLNDAYSIQLSGSHIRSLLAVLHLACEGSRYLDKPSDSQAQVCLVLLALPDLRGFWLDGDSCDRGMFPRGTVGEFELVLTLRIVDCDLCFAGFDRMWSRFVNRPCLLFSCWGINLFRLRPEIENPFVSTHK